MAYSCVEVWFEIGHEASVRTKRTPEGFTHDWEVFVRGVDNADIHYFVEKVVFYLHETFPKPKRVVKEPPYSIKESGYAGFNLPIEVYFKNKDEPKRVQYNYDLQLQPSGPPISKIKREKYTFSNPSEDFRRKLIRGGGVGVLGSEAVGNSVSSEKNSSEEGIPSVQPSVKHSSLSVAGKPKLSSESTKKTKVKDAKIEDIKPSNSFADLFGPPIKTAKVSPDPKKPQSKVSPVSKDSKALDKSDNADKHYSGIKTKHIPQKEIKKENASKDEKKDKNKERERSKDKNSSSSSKHSTSPKLAKEEAKKAQASDHKERVDAKNSEVKSDRKKEKKAKEEKVKKDKHKDVERGVTSERGEKSEKHSKENKEKEVKKSPKAVSKETEKVREKEKHRDSDKDKLRHKHKKKEKEKYKKVKDENKEKVKKAEPKTEEKENGNTTSEHRGEKRKRSESLSLSPSPRPSPVTPISPEKPSERPPPVVKDKPAKHPLSQLFAELEDSFNSDSNSSPLSGDEDVIEFPKPKEKFSPPEVKPEPIKEPPRVEEKVKEPETPEVSVENTKSSKQKQSSHKEKSSQSSTGSKSKSKEKSSKKKERDSGEITSEETTEKKRKKRSKKGKETEDENEERRKESGETADSAGRQAVDNSSNYKHKFSKEYVSELLDLQKKIMTINDGEELQKVVHVLAQSGKYEINSKTFDVDLCALDKSTVKKLQEFFSAS